MLLGVDHAPHIYILMILFLIFYYINVRENRKGNQEWTIMRNGQYWANKTKTTNTTHLKLKSKHTINVFIMR